LQQLLADQETSRDILEASQPIFVLVQPTTGFRLGLTEHPFLILLSLLFRPHAQHLHVTA
jgi:hypothetical protein